MDDKEQAYWDSFERTCCKADWFIEDPDADDGTDNTLYISVVETYVGVHPNLRTIGYTLEIHDDEGKVTIKRPITPAEMVQLGTTMLNAGLSELKLR